MPIIDFEMRLPAPKDTPARRHYAEVVGAVDSGASERGSTFYKTLFVCPREWALRYVVGLTPVKPGEALAIGWLYHYALERMYWTMYLHQQKCLQERPGCYDNRFFRGADSEAAQAALIAIRPILSEPGYEETAPVVSRLVDTYITRFWGHDRWEILAVEENLSWFGAGGKKHIASKFDYTARLDLIVRDFDRAHQVFITEHKTARALTADLIDNYEQDLQMLGQVWLFKKCVDISKYGTFGGITINIITKAKAPQVLRHQASLSKHHLRAFEESLVRWQHYLKWVQHYDYPRMYGHCSGATRGYSRCQFFDVCHAYPQLGVEDWKRSDAPEGFVKLRRKKAA